MEKKIFSEKEFNKLTSNMEIIEHDGFFDGYAIYIFIEAKKDNETFWFVKLQAPNQKPKYLRVQEKDIKWLNELRQTDKERLSMMLSYFIFL